MNFDRTSAALLALMTISGGAVAAEIVASSSGSVAVVEDEGELAFDEAELEDMSAEDDEEVASWTPEECDLFADPDDPKHLTSAEEPVYDDELRKEIDYDEEGYFSEFVKYCEGESAGNTRVAYTVGRVELLLGRTHKARERFELIERDYPSAAYRLVEMRLETGYLPTVTEDPDLFEKTLARLALAYRGGDQRAEQHFRDMANKMFPASRLAMPGLAAALWRGDVSAIPDTEATRMAVHSFMGGFRAQCEKWRKPLRVSPTQDKALTNFMLPITANRMMSVLTGFPAWLTKTVNGFGSSSDPTTMFQKLNDTITEPAQMMYVIDKAAEQDGYTMAEALGCETQFSDRIFDNTMSIVQSREYAKPQAAEAGALEGYAKAPDPMTLI